MSWLVLLELFIKTILGMPVTKSIHIAPKLQNCYPNNLEKRPVTGQKENRKVRFLLKVGMISAKDSKWHPQRRCQTCYFPLRFLIPGTFWVAPSFPAWGASSTRALEASQRLLSCSRWAREGLKWVNSKFLFTWHLGACTVIQHI